MPSTGHPRRTARSGAWLFVAGLLLVLSIGETWPTWTTPGTLVGGGTEPDWTGTAWMGWWVGHALGHGLNPVHATLNFYPVGQSQLAWYNMVDALLAAPLYKLFEPQLAYNLFAVFALWTAGLGMVALARTAGTSLVAAALAGVALQTSSFLVVEVTEGRIGQALVVFWLLALAALDRLARGEGGWRLSIATGLLAAVTAYDYWFYAVFLAFAAIPLWLARARELDRGRLGRLALAVAVALACCLPAAWSLEQAWRDLPGVTRPPEPWMQRIPLCRNHVGLCMALHDANWPGWPFAASLAPPSTDRTIAPALGLLALGGFLLRHGRSGRGRWLAVAVVGYVFSLGPFLRTRAGTLVKFPMHGQMLPVPLPYKWLHDLLPFFDRMWWPSRFDLLVAVGLGVLAAIHLDEVSRRLRRAALRPLLALATFVAISVGRTDLPIPARPPPRFATDLYEPIDRGAILTTPVLGSDRNARFLLWMQVFHERPTLTGLGDHIDGHRPPSFKGYVRRNRLLRYLSAVTSGHAAQVTIRPDDVSALIADGFAWAVVDPAAYSIPRRRAYAQVFTRIFTEVWGAPEVRSAEPGAPAAAWRIRAIAHRIRMPAVTLPKLPDTPPVMSAR